MAEKKLIAVSSETNMGLDGAVASHFGGCPYFTLVEVDDCNIINHRVVENPFFQAHQPGAIPNFINEQGANVILSGGMGGRAQQFFAQFGIEPVTGAMGTIRDAVNAYLSNNLKGAEPCKHDDQDHGHGHGHGCGH